ncbi:MAG: hypothetical protein OEW05_12540 [Candidatus Aminicenantes bacterium]|nr:hypothetical protein [Candidatus Aminicenantes bacterium]
MKKFYTVTAALSLAACLAAPVLRFLNLLADREFRLSFLLASLAWFIAATIRVSWKTE